MSQMSKEGVYETLDKVNGKVQLQRVKKGTSSCPTDHTGRALPVPLTIQREHFLCPNHPERTLTVPKDDPSTNKFC